MRSFQPFPRRELKRLRRRWLRRNWGIVAFLLVGFALMAALVSFGVAMTGLAGRWYVIGVFHAGLLAAALHLVNFAFLAHEASAVWQLRGAWGEENTRSELQRASGGGSSGGGSTASRCRVATSTTWWSRARVASSCWTPSGAARSTRTLLWR